VSARESTEAALVRWRHLELLQTHYRHFIDFLRDGMELLGFSTSEIQEDIAQYLENGPQSLMVQAQRGQAKTTIAALFAVWCLIHNPKLRVLIISAGGTQANEISTLIVRVIQTMDVLECLRPDANAGDRTSVEHFDVHHSLKGIDKSPSVACVGITANLQGKRADLLIADDIESAKNAATALQRAQLNHLTLDFTSICRDGRIVWLGTPQSADSIYNGLPGRGVTIRIWPGRYPTPAQIAHYGEHLAPLIQRRLAADPSLGDGGGMLGDQGKPLDPVLMNEDQLLRKELDQGTAYFQLQHMLNTRLTDAMRHPLKTERIQVLRFLPGQPVPIEVIPSYTQAGLRAFTHGSFGFKLCEPAGVSPARSAMPTWIMYIDPAGGGANADETGYAVTGQFNGNVFLAEVGGIPGGYGVDKMQALAEVAHRWKVSVVIVEKNMGYGAFREIFIPILHQIHKCKVDEDYVHGQKETRIIATLEPIIGRGSLIVNEDCVTSDWESAQKYGSREALTYSFFFQLSKLTRERGALVHDDRLDAVEGACRYWQALLSQDQERLRKESDRKAWLEQTKDPLGYERYRTPAQRGGSLLSRRLGRR
jgi:hypothetical protein